MTIHLVAALAAIFFLQSSFTAHSQECGGDGYINSTWLQRQLAQHANEDGTGFIASALKNTVRQPCPVLAPEPTLGGFSYGGSVTSSPSSSQQRQAPNVVIDTKNVYRMCPPGANCEPNRNTTAAPNRNTTSPNASGAQLNNSQNVKREPYTAFKGVDGNYYTTDAKGNPQYCGQQSIRNCQGSAQLQRERDQQQHNQVAVLCSHTGTTISRGRCDQIGKEKESEMERSLQEVRRPRSLSECQQYRRSTENRCGWQCLEEFQAQCGQYTEAQISGYQQQPSTFVQPRPQVDCQALNREIRTTGVGNYNPARIQYVQNMLNAYCLR